MPVQIFVLIGVVFGLLGAFMAFIIMYREYERHQLVAGRAWKSAVTVGAAALLVFVILMTLAGYLLFGIRW